MRYLVIEYGQGKEAAHRVRFKSVQFGRLASQVEGLELDCHSWRVELIYGMVVA
jgi:hypothetical protein